MGADVRQDDTPLMCFNAAHSWELGWYNENGKEGHLTLPPGPISWDGQLVGIDDYLYTDDFVNGQHRVVVKIESPTTSDYNDLYIMYNRMEGVNNETHSHGDKVTVVSAQALDGQTWLEAFITEDNVEGHRFTDWDGNGNDLVIEVCERVFGAPDYARVLVYTTTDNAENDLSCSTTAAPVSNLAPTMFSSASP
jgi:hypothetical protein